MHFDDIGFVKQSQEYIIVLSDGIALSSVNNSLWNFFRSINILEKDGYAFGHPTGSNDVYIRVKFFASDVEAYYVCEEIKHITAEHGCKCIISPVG